MPIKLDDIKNRIGQVAENDGNYVVHVKDKKINTEQQSLEIGQLFDKLIEYIDQERAKNTSHTGQTPPRVVVDLSNATFVDKSAMGKLISLHKTLKSRQGDLTVAVPDTNVEAAFKITKLDKFLKIVRSLDDALFQPPIIVQKS